MKSVSRTLGGVLVAGALALTAVLGVGRLNSHAQTSLVNNFPGHVYAPYVDLTASPTQSLVGDSQSGGIKFYSLAFITANSSRPCEAAWGSAVPLSQLSTFLPNLDSDIQSLRSRGGDVTVSFGGAAGTELAQSCTSQSALQAQYQSIIDHYQVSHLDFDIEGPAVEDAASIDLRNRTLAALEAANPGLVVSYTLPVLPTGLVASGINLLKNAIADGVRVNVVDIMAMDYGSSFPPDKMGQNAIDASNSLISQLKSLFPSKSDAQIRAMVGVTPMSGANDVAPENFTLADAQQLLGYAQSAGITELAMWSVNRDASAFSYSKIFDQFNGSSPAPTPTPTATPTPRPTATPTPRPTATPPPPTPVPGNRLANAGFESGSLSPWSCSPLDSVVGSPVHSGAHALSAAANSSDNAQCTQTIAVQAGHSYTLTGWVQGTYAFIGVTGTGTSDPSTFTPSSAGYTQLSVPFTTGASTTSVTVFVHGWYGQGTIFADDLSVS
jgi:chitinase